MVVVLKRTNMGKKERLLMGKELGKGLSEQGFNPTEVLGNLSMLLKIINEEDSLTA